MLILFVAAADLRDTQQETCPATKDNEGKEGEKKRKNRKKKKTHRKIQAQAAMLQSFAEIMCWVMHVPGGEPAQLLCPLCWTWAGPAQAGWSNIPAGLKFNLAEAQVSLQ